MESAEDVLTHLPEAPHTTPLFAPSAAWFAPEPARQLVADSPNGLETSSQVLDMLGGSPIAVDEVMRRCHLSPSAIQAILLDLELAGRVELLPGNRVALTGRTQDGG